jgi:hypothetical protein
MPPGPGTHPTSWTILLQMTDILKEKKEYECTSFSRIIEFERVVSPI